jgi:hypothetical protein
MGTQYAHGNESQTAKGLVGKRQKVTISETLFFPVVRGFCRVDPGGLDSPGTDGAGVFTGFGHLAVAATRDRRRSPVPGNAVGRRVLLPQGR